MKNLKIVGIQVKKKFFECLSRLRVKKRTLSISPGPISQSVMFVAQEKKFFPRSKPSQPARRDDIDHDFFFQKNIVECGNCTLVDVRFNIRAVVQVSYWPN